MKNHKIEKTGRTTDLPTLKQSIEDPTSRVPYARPQILSAEELEAAAASCDPAAGGFGKTLPSPCGTLGS